MTESDKRITRVPVCRHSGHGHTPPPPPPPSPQPPPPPPLSSSLFIPTQSSWNQSAQRQQRIISPVTAYPFVASTVHELTQAARVRRLAQLFKQRSSNNAVQTTRPGCCRRTVSDNTVLLRQSVLPMVNENSPKFTLTWVASMVYHTPLRQYIAPIALLPLSQSLQQTIQQTILQLQRLRLKHMFL